MSESRFIVRDLAIRQNAVSAVSHITQEPLMVVEIKPYVEDKTAEQRAFWHVLVRQMAKETGWTESNMKLILKARLFGVKEVNINDIKLVVPAQSTEKLNRKQYSDLIDETYVYAGEAGITLPPPRWRC